MPSRMPEEIDLREVCELLGIVVRKGRIPCPSPEHEEKHADNCQVKRSKNGRWYFKCHVCQAFGGATDLVRIVKGFPGLAEAFDWLREVHLLEEDEFVPAKPSKPLTEKDYLGYTETFLGDGKDEHRVAWMLGKHLEWQSESVPYAQRVREIIAKNRTLNEIDVQEEAAQERMRRWEETGEGFPEAEIRARLKKERRGFLRTPPNRRMVRADGFRTGE